jgi:hypothetical protein
MKNDFGMTVMQRKSQLHPPLHCVAKSFASPLPAGRRLTVEQAGEWGEPKGTDHCAHAPPERVLDRHCPPVLLACCAASRLCHVPGCGVGSDDHQLAHRREAARGARRPRAARACAYA